MTLRTPHRRISPRTKRRYRAIRDFLRRALGNSSRQSIKINSSIAVNVTDLKHKVLSLERQLSEVSRHFNEASKKTTESEVSTKLIEAEIKSLASEISLDRDSLDIETRYINKNAYNSQTYADGEESKHGTQASKYDLENKNMSYNTFSKRKKKSKLNFELHHQGFEPKNERFHKSRSESKENCLLHSTATCHSLVSSNRDENNIRYSDYLVKKYSKDRKKYGVKLRDDCVNQINRNEPLGSPKYKDNNKNAKRSKHHHSGIDQHFIADIIKRQYGPVKYFGRRESDISQFSAPVCRDQEFTFKDFIQEGTDLCSCFHRRDRHNRQNCNNIQLEDMRSVCDTRLYSSKNHTRHKHHRNCHKTDIYNDSELYDLVPVKEKSSPRSRRKFVEDNLMQYDHYKEVPPSPRSQRPRLNLRVQYYNDVEDYTVDAKQPAIIRALQRNKMQYKSEEKLSSGTELENIDFSRKIHTKKPIVIQKDVQIQQDMIPFNSLQYPVLPSNMQPDTHLINCNSNANKIQSAELCVDKTDNALSEIKDILQNFLQEIKKESASSSQCEKFESSITTTEKNLNNLKVKDKETNSTESNSNNYRNEPLFIPPLCMPNVPNQCFCPILPVCSMNHNMQNGCVLPTASFTCHNCKNPKENVSHNIHCKTTKRAEAETSEALNKPDNETEQMIKEIYKVVSQNPDILRKSTPNNRSPTTISPRIEKKILTSTSVGENVKTIKHDAKVGTPKLKQYSKSCEAISSQMMSEMEYDREERPKAGYSDTILEKMSLEATNSSDYEQTYTTTVEEKAKESKFAKVLKSLPFFKKKKKDIIEELSESESSTEVYKKGPHTPFRQEVANYMMHGQEYLNELPVSPHPHCHHGFYNPHPPGSYGCPNISGPRHSCCPSPMQTSAYNMYGPQTLHQHTPHYPSIPTAPPYSHSFGAHHKQIETNVPFCLKEIEVKSIATQSDRKMTFFQKWSKKMQPPPTSNQEDELRNCSTQTSPDKNQKFSWKMLQQKNSPQHNMDPIKFSFNAQRELASGDMKLKNVMMKKLFYKRNPFSPRNLIIRTLLGKDKTSYGDPPKMYRPKLFL